MRLGIFGGTFDPVHVGHLLLGEAAREELALDRVLFVPAGRPWRKAEREITRTEHRVAMVRLAVQDNPAFEVSTVEIETPGSSYTVATLERIVAKNANAELFVIVGVDAFRDMPNWKEPEKIAQLAVIAVTGRMGYREGVEDSRTLLRLRLGKRVTWFEMPMIGLSATAVRQRVSLGKSIRYLVPPAVGAYIRENGLYAD